MTRYHYRIRSRTSFVHGPLVVLLVTDDHGRPVEREAFAPTEREMDALLTEVACIEEDRYGLAIGPAGRRLTFGELCAAARVMTVAAGR